MKQTSRISSSRAVHGSRPSTRSSPSNDVRPRIALSAVVLPAPLGPMSPRMRPSSTRRSMPSTATVLPNVLRRPRASMQGMASALLRWARPLVAARRSFEQFARLESEAFDRRANARPVLGQKLLPFVPQEQRARPGDDEHAEPAPFLDEAVVSQRLVGLEDG